MTTELHVCVPVLNRYDALAELVTSLNHSTLVPAGLHVIDNGAQHGAVEAAVSSATYPVYLSEPGYNLGVAASWNWFINSVPPELLISNDDIVFAPDTLARMVAVEEACVVALDASAFSCFLLRESCIRAVGYFDEAISPGYGYFEDLDYKERMKAAGLTTHRCPDAGVAHVGSGTLKASSPAEVNEHHRKFVLAQENFIRKHGYLPPGVVRQT